MDDHGEPEAGPCSGESAPPIKIEVDADGTERWYRNDELHRADGPAVVFAGGTKMWYRGGKRHREDGPAIEWMDGDKMWFRGGLRHREDGPAIEHANCDKKWYLHGMRVTEHEHRRKAMVPKLLFIAVCASRRSHVPRGGKRYWLPAELWGYLAEHYFAL